MTLDLTHDLAAQGAARRPSPVAGAARRTAAVLAAGLALVVAAAGTGQAAGTGTATAARQGCDGAAAPATATAPAAEAAPAVRAGGTAAQRISFGVTSQLPIGLWSDAAVTLRTPVSKGTVRLDVTSRGFSTDSLVVQRYDARSHRWTDLATRPGGGSSPTHGVFTFPLTATGAGPRAPHTVPLRLQDLDRPGTLTVTASVTDGRGHTYRAPARTTTATRPATTVGGWPGGTTLRRGGPAHEFTVTVRNTTNRAYPALTASYFAYGAGSKHALAPKDLTLQQYRAGKGWTKVPLLAGGCDPGMSATLKAAAASPLKPGATAVYRLKVSVARTAPQDVTSADAGITVGNGDQAFASRQLPFAIRAK
ncbi:hypothetical protein GCM10010218_45960 [Streptomyces mashuensis]|uniref:Uncharacterized protein n=1 Tax=Streptomyces mashuensis TaxID=33904 RepID=A0A919EEP6_9ACTN|nr:hypothetical protein [Streptomyces mashuensis]GHF59288.1 hypothetical protein GCM10010218_45960 [Streptomyces mashuensis]